MSEKPDLSGYTPELREALIARRNFWRTKRGQAVEMWDPATEQLVDRDQRIVRQAVAATVEALTARSCPAVAETAPANTTVVAGDAPVVSTTPEPLAKPFAKMTRDEFAAAAAPHLAEILDRPRPVGLSPFWQGLVDQNAGDGAR